MEMIKPTIRFQSDQGALVVVGPAPRKTDSLMSKGAYFTGADDLASESSDWIAGKEHNSTFSSTQTTAWKAPISCRKV
jgi:hypothetical protein